MPVKHRLKYQLRSKLVFLFLKFQALLPLKLCHWMGSFTGYLGYLASHKLRKVAFTNVQACFPELSTTEQKNLVRRSFLETGKTLAEAGPMWLWSKEKILGLIKSVEGEEILQDACKKGKGVIIAFPHLGNWEILSLYCSARFPVTTLYKKPRLEQLDPLIRHGRERLGARLVPIDNSGIRLLLQALNKGEIVGILPDQEPASGKGVFAPFFNIPAYSMTLVSRLVQKTKAEVILGYAQRLPAGKGYTLKFSLPPRDISSQAIECSVHSLNQGIENCIRQAPEQYQWSYKRFRKRPDNSSLIYS